MSTANINVVEVTTPSAIKKFIDLPYRIYKDYPYWVPPLNFNIKEKLDKKKNPFFQYGEVILFAALNQREEMVGRMAAIVNPVHNKLYNDKTAFFGLFECTEDIRIAKSLFHKVSEYLNQRGFNNIIGPVNFTTNDECGILVRDFYDSSMIMCSYSPPYYDEYIKCCGFEKAIDLYSYEGLCEHIFPAKFYKVSKRTSVNPKLTFRVFRKENLWEDTKLIMDLYNKAFAKVWGFVPLTEDESLLMAETFTKFYDKELIWIAFHDNNPAGFILALPDINQVLKKLNGKLFPFGIIKLMIGKKKIDALRVLTLGVLEEYRGCGIETHLIEKIHSRMKSGGYRKAELSVVMENNYCMRRVLEHMGFTNKKTYRLYKAIIL